LYFLGILEARTHSFPEAVNNFVNTRIISRLYICNVLLCSALLWSVQSQFPVKVRPIEPSSENSKRTVGFSKIPATESGVTFRNSLSDDQIAGNQNLMNGSGVAAGDINGDGLCDLYFCGVSTDNALYLNQGDWKFREVTAQSGVALKNTSSTGAIFGDIDGDSDLDLLVGTLGSGVRFFENDGKGSFTENTRAARLNSSTGSTSMALSDIDNDGDLDLYVTNYGTIPIINSGVSTQVKRIDGKWTITGPYAERLRILDNKLEELGEPDVLYLNDGDGVFSAAPWNSDRFLQNDGTPQPEPWEFGLAVQIRDINGDHAPDIYVCNDFQSPDRLWINDGTGNFRLAPPLALRKESFASMGVDFADIDHDGDLDFFVVEMLPRSRPQQLRQAPGVRPSLPQPGLIDNRPEVSQNTFFLNRGNGTYAEIAHALNLAGTDWSWQPLFLDVDLDTWADLLIVNGMLHNVQDRDTLEAIRGASSRTRSDARRNFLRYPSNHSPNYAFRNTQKYWFENQSEHWGFTEIGVTQGIATADLDNDGDLDLITNNLRDQPSLFQNLSQASRITIRLKGKKPNTQAIGAKLTLSLTSHSNQTHEITAGGQYLSGSDTLCMFAFPYPETIAKLTVRWPDGTVTSLESLKPNHHYSVEKSNQEQSPEPTPKLPSLPWFTDASHKLNHRHHETGFNDFRRQPLLSRLHSQGGPGVGWADLNGDRQDELIIGSGSSGTISVFGVTSEGKFHLLTGEKGIPVPDDTTGFAHWSTSSGEQTQLIGVTNYEGEKTAKSAILSVSFSDNIPTIDQIGDTNPGPLAVADIDSDGDLDLFIGGQSIAGAYPLSTKSRIFRQKEGILRLWEEGSQSLKSLKLVVGAVWSDLVGDTRPELVVSTRWGPIHIYRQTDDVLEAWDPLVVYAPSNSIQAQVLSEITGLWSGIATGDFDNDGRLDIIAGNWGINDRLRASTRYPLTMHYGDIVNSKTPGTLLSNFAPFTGEYYPEHDFALLRQFLPSLQPISNHKKFSEITMPQLLSTLPSALSIKTAVTLESTLFLNRGDHLLAHPLPPPSQWAPVWAVNVSDFDADGNEDVFLGQNFFAVRPGRARMDAGTGLILKGLGDGSFLPVSPNQSGIKIYGEQRGAATGDFNRDGRIDLVVTQNGSQTYLLQNTGTKAGIRVHLIGPQGNPRGIGAKIRLEGESGAGPIREIQAGSGYWSNNSSIQILGSPQEYQQIIVTWPDGSTTKRKIESQDTETIIRYSSG
jgi:hypothetical protein